MYLVVRQRTLVNGANIKRSMACALIFTPTIFMRERVIKAPGTKPQKVIGL
jgi:hypothetical protein